VDPGNKRRDDWKQAARKATLLQRLIALLHPRGIDIHLPAHLAELGALSRQGGPLRRLYSLLIPRLFAATALTPTHKLAALSIPSDQELAGSNIG
jgi:hypothetical protein